MNHIHPCKFYIRFQETIAWHLKTKIHIKSLNNVQIYRRSLWMISHDTEICECEETSSTFVFERHHLDKNLLWQSHWNNSGWLVPWSESLLNSLRLVDVSTSPEESVDAYLESGAEEKVVIRGESLMLLPSSWVALPVDVSDFFVLTKRPPHPRARLKACKWRDSWR